MHSLVVSLRLEDNLVMKLITVNHLVCTTLMTLRRSLGQRSRSDGDGHSNLVNATAPEQLKGFESKLELIVLTVGPQTG